MAEKNSDLDRRKLFLEEILKELPDPIHKKLIQAYQGDNPVESMESELKKILLGVLQNEN